MVIFHAAFAHAFNQLFGLVAGADKTIKNYPKFWVGKGKGIYLFPKFYRDSEKYFPENDDSPALSNSFLLFALHQSNIHGLLFLIVFSQFIIPYSLNYF